MVESGGRGLDPVEPLAAADFVPGNGNFGVAAKNVGVEQFFSDVFLAGVDDVVVGSRGSDLGDVASFDRVAENDSFTAWAAGTGLSGIRWRLWLNWHSIGCCQPRLFWQVEIGSIESLRPTSSVQAYYFGGSRRLDPPYSVGNSAFAHHDC